MQQEHNNICIISEERNECSNSIDLDAPDLKNKLEGKKTLRASPEILEKT